MIIAINAIKQAAAAAALNFATAAECNPYPQGTDAAAAFKKYFEQERMFLEHATQAETAITNAISTGAAIDIMHSINQFEPISA